MGFLNWFKQNPEEESEQLSLLGQPSQLARNRRVDGAIVREDFTRQIKDKGGDGRAIARSTEAMTEELFDCSTDELYKETGGKKGDRRTLPTEAQKAYMVGETVSTHDLRAKQVSGSQSQKNREIADTVRDSSKKTRKLFPW